MYRLRRYSCNETAREARNDEGPDRDAVGPSSVLMGGCGGYEIRTPNTPNLRFWEWSPWWQRCRSAGVGNPPTHRRAWTLHRHSEAYGPVRLSVLTDETTSPGRQREADDQAAAALGIDFGEGDALREAVDLDVSASKIGPFDRPELGKWHCGGGCRGRVR